MYLLAGKRVLLCVSGSIAAYKAADLVRRLQEVGAEVQVAMTSGGRAFITPLTLQALSKRPVALELLDTTEDAQIGHIELAEEADVVLVAPATANLIARMAAGMADDIVTALLLVTRAPVVVAPAMNTNMLEHPAVQANLRRMAELGYRVVESDSGELACGQEGAGRLPDPDELIAEVAAALSERDLEGCRVLVSAGPTREPLDPVRYLSNRSSGRMGYEIAAAAWRRGARVTVVSGPSSLAPPRGAEMVAVETAAEMQAAMEERVGDSDVVVMVAAVADYRPANVAAEKIKKLDEQLAVPLERTTDILARLSDAPGKRVLVGFAAETESVRDNAKEKLARKGLDLIVANDVAAADRGFEVATNAALLIDRDGGEEETGLIGKDELADRVLDRVAALRAASS